MKELKIKISDDFTKFPGPRYRNIGKFSAEEFRDEILEKKYLEAKKQNVKLIVDIDDTRGFPPSFLEESFGGLKRKYKNDNIFDKIEIKYSESNDYYYQQIKQYVNDAMEKVKNISSKQSNF